MNTKSDINHSTIDVVSNIQFTDILNLEDIQHFQELFSEASGVASIITHPDGTPITDPVNFCKLCGTIIRKTEKGMANCQYSDSIIGRHNTTGPIVAKCLSGGLWDAGASITVGGKHIANWLIGQVRTEEFDKERMLQYADEIGADRVEFLSAMNEVPVMSAEQFQKVSEMLFAFANELSEKAYRNLQLKKEIAEREEANKLLHESREILSTTLLSIGDGVISTDNYGLVTNMNPVAESLCGWSINEALGKPLTEVFHIIHSKTRELVVDPVRKVLETGQITGLANHTVLVSRDGTEYQIADSAAPIKNKEGIVSGVVLAFSDVTAKYEADEIIRQNEEKFHNLYINMIEGAVLHELIYNDQGVPEDYTIIETNPAFELQLGISRESVIGKTSKEAYGVPEPPYFDIYTRVALTGEPVVFESYYPPLSKHFSISAYCPSHGHFATIFEDITERKVSETELREKELQYRNLADSGLALIWTAGTDKLCNYFNEPWYKFTGRTPSQEYGNGWAEGVHPSDFEHCLQTYVTAFDKRETFAMEYRLRHVSGEYRWLLDKGTPNYNSNGEFVGYIGHCFDINDLKQAVAEVKLKNEELHELVIQKDRFFSIIAHDLRSPFNSFLGLTQIMAEELPSLTMAEIQKIAVSMRSSATNLFRLLENLLQWSRIQKGSIQYNPEIIQLLPVVDESIAMVLELARSKVIEIVYEIPVELTVFADNNILQTVIRNLVSNAVKFTPKEGTIILTAKKTVENSVEISIKDSGIGMNKEMVGNLFRINEQANRKGTDGEPSTGLGLLLCREFIGKHGGKIWVESEEGKGSIFYFTIPNNDKLLKD